MPVRILRWTGKAILRLFVSLLVLFIVAWFLLQLPIVQNYVVGKICAYLSDELHATVSIKHVSIDFFDRIELEGLYIEDQKHDTLLYADYAKADIAMLSLLEKKVELDGVILNHPVVRLGRASGEQDYNFKFLIDYFGPQKNKDPNAKKSPFLFSLKYLTVLDTDIEWNDIPKGQYAHIRAEGMDIKLKEMNTILKHIDIDDVDLKNGNIEIRTTQREIPLPTDTTAAATVSTDTIPLWLHLNKVSLNNCQLRYDDTRFAVDETRELDPHHIFFNNINIQTDSIKVEGRNIAGRLSKLQLKEARGFELNNLQAHLKFTESEIALDSIVFKTPRSLMTQANLSFKYNSLADFKHFDDEVYIKADFKDTHVSLQDVLVFAPALSKNKFFRNNVKQMLTVSGEMRGKINSLKGKNLDVRLGSIMRLQGEFSSRDLTHKGSEFLSLQCDELRTTAPDLIALLPSVKFPPNVARLGKVVFKGNFTGFLRSTGTAYGEVTTDLGTVRTDLTLDLHGGLPDAKYNGKIAIRNFQLDKYLNDPQFGLTSLALDVNGKGTMFYNTVGNVEGTLERFSFKGYEYKNVKIKGKLENKRFDGVIISKDANADFSFVGKLDLQNTAKPSANLLLVANRIDLKALHLIEADEYTLSAWLSGDFTGKTIDDFVGNLRLSNLKALKNGKPYELNELTVNATFDQNKRRKIILRSALIDASLVGMFRVDQLPLALKNFAEINYPRFAHKLGLLPENYTTRVSPEGDSLRIPILAVVPPQEVYFSATIKDAGVFTDLIPGQQLKALKGANVFGQFSSDMNLLHLAAFADKITVGKTTIQQLDMTLAAEGNITHDTIRVANIIVDTLKIPGVDFRTSIERDTLRFSVGVASPFKPISSVALAGKLFFTPDNDLTQLVFTRTTSGTVFTLWGRSWSIADDNYIRFKKNYIEAHNVSFINKEQSITLSDIAHQGLDIHLSNIDLTWILSNIKMDPRFKIGGMLNGSVGVTDVFAQKGLYGTINVLPIINKDNWGIAKVKFSSPDLKHKITLDTLLAVSQFGKVEVDGWFLPAFATTIPEEKNSFEANILLSGISPKPLEYMLAPNVSGIEGQCYGRGSIWGTFKTPNIKGNIKLIKGAATVEMLKTRYFIKDADATVDNIGFHFANQKLYDKFDNPANINGTISFNRLRDWGVNLVLSSSKKKGGNGNILAMNTTPNDNRYFYGTVFGDVEVTFFGEFKHNVDLHITGRTNYNTQFNIPIYKPGDARRVNYVKFIDKEKILNDNLINKTPIIKGINLFMALEVTPDAECRMIFDEQEGEILSGHGDALLNITYDSKTEELSMSGDYNVTKGNYLYAYSFGDLLPINKPFEIRSGGLIRWTGDPYEAQININAYYKGLRVSYYDLISDLVVNDPAAKGIALQPADIDLGMNLSGALLSPDISFSLAVPRLDPKIKSLVENRVRSLSEDKNALNRQVFGLIVLKRFLPEGGAATNSTAQSNLSSTGNGVANTLTELLLNQASMYLTGILSEAVSDLDFISSVDVNLSANLYNTESVNLSSTRTTGTTVNAALSPSLMNGRITLRLGGNLDVGAGGNTTPGSATDGSNAYLGPDFLFEYKITTDGRFRIRAYGRSDYGQVNGSFQHGTRFGAGLSFRREFDDLSFFKKWLKKNVKKQPQ